MTQHAALGDTPYLRGKKLKQLIDTGSIKYAGNSKLKIYGLLTCSSGKRMKVENRVFFTNENEAELFGYRPCGHCMKAAYMAWKKSKH